MTSADPVRDADSGTVLDHELEWVPVRSRVVVADGVEVCGGVCVGVTVHCWVAVHDGKVGDVRRAEVVSPRVKLGDGVVVSVRLLVAVGESVGGGVFVSVAESLADCVDEKESVSVSMRRQV